MRLLIAMLLLISSTVHAASIWHVSGEKDFYLFGTIHVLKPDAYPLPPVYERVFSQCQKLWLEVDQAEMEDTSLLLEAQKLMLLPPDQSIESLLTKASHKKLNELAALAGLDLVLFQGLKPWAAVNVLTVTIMQMQGFEIEKGLDGYLAGWAARDGIPTEGLESLMWQMAMLDEIGSQYTDDFIEFSTNDMENVEKLVEDLVRYWQQGDIASLYQQADFEDYPDVERILLNQRNDKWMKTLLAKSSMQTQCVAVGALHMAGPHGLLKQFEKYGYQVTKLN
ncbi:TraB/GumN family protein [Reinekea sp.]|jgi:uncharacterized protein YbaP (TraB family)|uniref:TraB/GumN family protein n=1 Tax=Reinekea sp. TaxID=1970455 RepID=UPI00398A4CA3